MPTPEEYASSLASRRMQRLTRTADELGAAIKGQSDAVLSRQPDASRPAEVGLIVPMR